MHTLYYNRAIILQISNYHPEKYSIVVLIYEKLYYEFLIMSFVLAYSTDIVEIINIYLVYTNIRFLLNIKTVEVFLSSTLEKNFAQGLRSTNQVSRDEDQRNSITTIITTVSI